MIRLLYGAGSDATAAALLSSMRQDLDAGGKVILLVPEQETVSAERRMVAALPPAAQLSFEVLNFSRLANRTFRTVGGLCYRYATPGAEALFMWRTLRDLAGTLKQYGRDAANLPRLTDRMLSAAVQFGAYCVTPERLLETAEKLESGDPLRDKLNDLGTILSFYENAIEQKYDHVRDDLGRLFRLLGEHPTLYADTHVYIDSFTDFTAEEWRVIGKLLTRARSLTLTTPIPSRGAAGIHLGGCEKTVVRFKQLAREAGETVHFDCEETDKPRTSLEKIRSDLFYITAEKAPLGFRDDGHLILTECPSPYAEAEQAAATVQKLVRAGCRYRDIAVVVRDAAAWCGILDAAFEKEGIPYFLSEKTDVTLRPLIKLLLFALRIKQYNWRSEDVIGYLKTGLAGVSDDDINFFEEYLDVWNPRGRAAFAAPFTRNPDGYTDAVSARGRRLLAAAEHARTAVTGSLFPLFESFDKAKTMKNLCLALYDFLLALGVPDQLKAEAEKALARQEKREAEELSRLFSLTMDALDTTADVIGDLPADLAAFGEALRLVFARTDIGTIPTSSDEVMVGSAATLRAERPRFAVVLGLNEGQFPAVAGRGGLLSDTEKHKLVDLGIELDGDSADAAADEMFYVWRAFTLPRERLYLSYASAGADGSDAAPSFAVARIKALFDNFPVQNFHLQPTLDRVFTPTGAWEHMPELSPADRAAALSLLTSDRDLDMASRYNIPLVDKAASVPAEQAETLFDDRSYNPTNLENFVKCRFAYYCNKVLGLRQTADDEMDYSETGTLMHDMLENVFRTAREAGRDFGSYDDDEIKALIRRIVDDYRARLTQSGSISPRSEAVLVNTAAAAFLVVRALFTRLKNGVFKPALFELNLAATDGASVIRLDDGRTIPLTGKIDRVDTATVNGQAYVRVIDYKTNDHTFDQSEIDNGFNLQMPLYLYALCRNDHPGLNERMGVAAGARLQPAGLCYIMTKEDKQKTGTILTAEAAEKGLTAATGNSGVHLAGLEPEAQENSRKKKTDLPLTPAEFDELFERVKASVARIVRDMNTGRADIDPHTPKDGRSPCDYCAYRAVCRAANQRKEEEEDHNG